MFCRACHEAPLLSSDVALSASPLLDVRLCACHAGQTLAENLAALPGLKEGQEVIMPVERPIKETGHLQVPTTSGHSRAALQSWLRCRACLHQACTSASSLPA